MSQDGTPGSDRPAQPGWRIQPQDLSFLFGENEQSVVLPLYSVDLSSEYLTKGQLPAHFGVSPTGEPNDTGDESSSSNSATKVEVEEPPDRWKDLGSLAGPRRMEICLLVVDHVGRLIDLRHALEAPLDMPSDSVKTQLKLRGAVCLDVNQLNRIRLYHASVLWLLHGQVTLADPSLDRFIAFAEKLPYNALICPFFRSAYESAQFPDLSKLDHHQLNNKLRTRNLDAFINWSYIDIFLKDRQDDPLDEAVHQAGTIFRTSYNASLYTLITKTYGEGLDTIVMIPAKVEGDHGDASVQDNMSIREYMRERRGLVDLQDTSHLLVGTPLSFVIKCAPQSIPHATKHVLPTLVQLRNDAMNEFDFAPDEIFSAKRFDNLSRRFLPQHAVVLPVTLLDLNFCSYLPIIMSALYRRFAALRLFFMISEDLVYPSLDQVHHWLQQPPELIPNYHLLPLHLLDITLIEQAMTCPSASLNYNYERLETFGDTVLKYLISYYLFLINPTMDEGGLTEAKKKYISNIALKNSPNAYILEKACFPNQLFMDVKKIRTVSQISFKMKADLCEAMLGAFYACWGTNGAHVFLSWLNPAHRDLIIAANQVLKNPDQHFARVPERFGLYLKDLEHDLQLQQARQQAIASSSSGASSQSPASQSSSAPHLPLGQEYMGHFAQTTVPHLPESFNGYIFTRPHLFATALTHTSATYRPTGANFERLEFLGDAALDLVLTALLYDNTARLDPGRMSLLRNHIAGNATYAFLGAAFSIHTMLIIGSTKVHDDLAAYVKSLETEVRCRNGIDLGVLLADAWVRNQSFPDSLADGFEAVMGAVFLDMGGDINRFAKWIMPSLKPVVLAHVNSGNPAAFGERHPVTELQELFQSKGCHRGDIRLEAHTWHYVWHGKILGSIAVSGDDKMDQRYVAKKALDTVHEIPDIWELCDCR